MLAFFIPSRQANSVVAQFITPFQEHVNVAAREVVLYPRMVFVRLPAWVESYGNRYACTAYIVWYMHCVYHLLLISFGLYIAYIIYCLYCLVYALLIIYCLYRLVYALLISSTAYIVWYIHCLYHALLISFGITVYALLNAYNVSCFFLL